MNTFEQILKDAQIERAKRQAKRRAEWAQTQSTLPQPKAPDDRIAQPIEYREYLRRKVKELLND